MNWDFQRDAPAWLALILSALSIVYARRALLLTEAQERKRHPKLKVELLNSRWERRGAERHYLFQLSASNSSDADNSIARAELALRISNEGKSLVLKIRSGKPSPGHILDSPAIELPVRIDAHQTIRGWLQFAVDETILMESAIEDFSIILADSHGVEFVVRPIAVPLHAVSPAKVGKDSS